VLLGFVENNNLAKMPFTLTCIQCMATSQV